MTTSGLRPNQRITTLVKLRFYPLRLKKVLGICVWVNTIKRIIVYSASGLALVRDNFCSCFFIKRIFRIGIAKIRDHEELIIFKQIWKRSRKQRNLNCLFGIAIELYLLSIILETITYKNISCSGLHRGSHSLQSTHRIYKDIILRIRTRSKIKIS